MKKVVLLGILILCIGFMLLHPKKDLEKVRSSLLEGEIAITFLNEDVLLIDFDKDSILLNMGKSDISFLRSKYHLDKDIKIYESLTKEIVDALVLDSTETGFTILYNHRKFCIGEAYGCDFTYIYNNSYSIDSDVYFYNNTFNPDMLSKNKEMYNISNKLITIIWNEQNHMIIES